MIRRADELLCECEQLTRADTTADTADTTADTAHTADTTADTAAAGDVATGAAERHHYDTLMHRYRDIIANISKLVAVAAESIQRRDSLNVSC